LALEAGMSHERSQIAFWEDLTRGSDCMSMELLAKHVKHRSVWRNTKGNRT
jgi:hypothetical protein